MVLFIGTTHESYFAKKMVEKRGEEYQVLDRMQELKYLVNDIIRTKAATVIIDISPFTEEIPEIIDSIDKIQEALNAKIIILAKGYLPGSQIIQALYNAGYTDFILDTVLAYMQKALEKCMDGVYAREGAPEEIAEAAKNLKKENANKKEEEAALKAIRAAQKKRFSIGVAGARHYIGTTTQVIQIAKYFIQAGKTAAIVEINSSGYFSMLYRLEDEKDYVFEEGLALLKYKGVDIYLEPERITKLIRQKYDCIVYDYGCYYDSDFQKISYYEKDVNCLVGGSKVNEYEQTNTALIENKDRENMYFLFSFTSKDEEKSIGKSMMNLADHTLFPAYTPDMFVYSPDNNYEKFFKYKLQAEKKKDRAGRFPFFRRKEET